MSCSSVFATSRGITRTGSGRAASRITVGVRRRPPDATVWAITASSSGVASTRPWPIAVEPTARSSPISDAGGSVDICAPATQFEIEDTQDDIFEPLDIPFEDNLFVYDPPPEIPPETVYPLLNSQASDNTIRGGMLLFKVTTDSLYNRPLELKIIDPEGGPDGMINLDI